MLTRALLLLLLTAPAASAPQRRPGPPPPQDPHAATAALLRSADATEQAWGSWYAGRDQLRQFVPELQHVVMSRLTDESQAGHAAVSIALDALIQLKQAVDADTLGTLYEKRPVQALVLASFGGKSRTPFLLEVMGTAEGENWFAAANLLLLDDRSALTRTLLGELTISAVVYLVNPGGGAAGGRAAGMSVGCGGIGMAPGLPPWAAYDLSSYGSPGMTVLSTGPVPIYYRRVLAPAGQTPAFCDSSRSGPDDADRMAYIAAIAGLQPDELPLRADNQSSLVWTSERQPIAEIARIRADLTRRHAALLQLLVTRNLLDAETARTIAPVIEIVIEDRRSPH
jgi:hypothetical protein